MGREEETVPTKRTGKKLKATDSLKFAKGILIGLSALTLAEAVLIIFLFRRQTVSIPYVIEINREGDARYVENAVERLAEWKPGTATVIKALEEYIVSLRGVSTDPDIQRERIGRIYAFSTGNALKEAERHLLDTRPLDRLQSEKVDVKVYAATPLIGGNENVYQLDWNERTHSPSGSLKSEKNYRAVMNVRHFVPRTKSVQETNPLGIYVTELEISEIRDGYVIYE